MPADRRLRHLPVKASTSPSVSTVADIVARSTRTQQRARPRARRDPRRCRGAVGDGVRTGRCFEGVELGARLGALPRWYAGTSQGASHFFAPDCFGSRCAMVTVISSPTTSSAWTTVPGSSTASSSTNGSGSVTCWATSRSWQWTRTARTARLAPLPRPLPRRRARLLARVARTLLSSLTCAPRSPACATCREPTAAVDAACCSHSHTTTWKRTRTARPRWRSARNRQDHRCNRDRNRDSDGRFAQRRRAHRRYRKPVPTRHSTRDCTFHWTDQTYTALIDRARSLLTDGESVVLDVMVTPAVARDRRGARRRDGQRRRHAAVRRTGSSDGSTPRRAKPKPRRVRCGPGTRATSPTASPNGRERARSTRANSTVLSAARSHYRAGIDVRPMAFSRS